MVSVTVSLLLGCYIFIVHHIVPRVLCNIVVVIPKPRNSITQNGYEFYAIAKIEGWNLQVFCRGPNSNSEFNYNILA